MSIIVQAVLHLVTSTCGFLLLVSALVHPPHDTAAAVAGLALIVSSALERIRIEIQPRKS